METFPQYDFPTNHLMVGSVIPGKLQRIGNVRLVSYPDGTRNPLLVGRERTIDPVAKYPSMHGEHTKDHPMLKRLKELFHSDKPPQKAGYAPGGFDPIPRPRDENQQGFVAQPRGLPPGYEEWRENRDWRRS